MSERIAETIGGQFEPAKYLVNLNGRGEYLEVKWRLLWLRTEHPEASIETELVRLEDHDAVFKARVTIPDGGSATGYGSESAGDFRDFLEKAETKAIGRALAALGYGTQFCQDHEFGGGNIMGNNGQMRIVDAPVDFAKNRGQRSGGGNIATAAQTAAVEQGNQRATERQVKFIRAIAREAGLDEQELADWTRELYNQEVDQLNRRDASTLIEALQRRRNEVA
ncbi:MAG TPA: hypothetical protein VIL85_24760 [Thermomicrobiales bacterium]|jgi:hypothetical protein